MKTNKMLGLLLIFMLLVSIPSFANDNDSIEADLNSEEDLPAVESTDPETTEEEQPIHLLSLLVSLPKESEGNVIIQSEDNEVTHQLISGENTWSLPEGTYSLTFTSTEGVIAPEPVNISLVDNMSMEIIFEKPDVDNPEIEDPETTEPSMPEEIDDPETNEPILPEENNASDKIDQEQSTPETDKASPQAVGDSVDVHIEKITHYDENTTIAHQVVDARSGFESGQWFNQEFGIYTDTATGMIGFCLNPFEAGPSGETTQIDYLTRYSAEIRRQAELIALNGFYLGGIDGFLNHQNFLFTQRRLWELLPVQSPFTGETIQAMIRFTDGSWINTLPGIEEAYQNWLNALTQKIDNYNTRPSFSGQSLNLKVGETITLTDHNGVLSSYRFGAIPSGLSITVNGNTLTISVTGVVSGRIDFVQNIGEYEGVGYITEKAGIDPISGLPYQDLGFFKDKDPTRGFITVTSTNPTGSISLTKKQTGTENIVKGATYALATDQDFTNIIGTAETNADGQIYWADLAVGTYYVKETIAPEGYVLDPTIYTVVVNDEQTTELNVTDKQITGTPTITKIDVSTKEPLPNTVIELYDENDNLIESKTTDENGHAEFSQVSYGRYYFLEKQAPEGYLINPDKHWFEIREDGEIIKSTMTNQMITGTPTITKIDVSTKEPLPNTVIELYDENDNLIESKTTDENGYAEFSQVSYGRYYFLEKQAPEGYVINSDKHWFEIREDGEIIKSTMTNQLITGEFEAIKKDAENDKPVPGATYTIYKDGQIVAELITDEEGRIHINLPYGHYTMKETSAPEGYVLDPKEYQFFIEEQGKLYFQALVEEPIYSVVQITKKDSISLKVVPGATIVFYNEAGEVVYEGVTDENGMIKVRLRYGKYTYKETIAPAGYILAEKIGKISITEDGVTIEEVFYNEPIPVKQLPNTGAKHNIILISLGVTLLGISLFLFLKRKTFTEG